MNLSRLSDWTAHWRWQNRSTR